MENVQNSKQSIVNYLFSHNINFVGAKKIILAIAVVLVLGVSYMKYQSNKVANIKISSEMYSAMMNSLNLSDQDNAQEIALGLIKDYPHTSYAHLAGLLVAKFAVDTQDYTLAEDRLKWVINADNNGLTKSIAITRLSRLYLSESKAKEALELIKINAPYSEAQKVAIEVIKGDAYMMLGEKNKALDSYRYVADNLPAQQDNTYLNYKLIDLGVKNDIEKIVGEDSNE